MLIGLTGRAGVGKTTAARRIEEIVLLCGYGMKVEQRSFASKLKESLAGTLGLDRVHIELWKNEPDVRLHITTPFSVDGRPVVDISFRQLLQQYGTEGHRQVFGWDFWVEYAMADLPGPNTVVVWDDVRLDNEAEAIIKAGGRIIEIDPYQRTRFEGDHLTEQGINPLLIDEVVYNLNKHDDYLDLDAHLYPLIWQGPHRTHVECRGIIEGLREGVKA